MGVIPAQDPGTGKSHPVNEQPGKAHPGKGKPNKGREYFFNFGPVGRAAPKECVGGSLKRTKRTDARTCDILK